MGCFPIHSSFRTSERSHLFMCYTIHQMVRYLVEYHQGQIEHPTTWVFLGFFSRSARFVQTVVLLDVIHGHVQQIRVHDRGKYEHDFVLSNDSALDYRELFSTNICSQSVRDDHTRRIDLVGSFDSFCVRRTSRSCFLHQQEL